MVDKENVFSTALFPFFSLEKVEKVMTEKISSSFFPLQK